MAVKEADRYPGYLFAPLAAQAGLELADITRIEIDPQLITFTYLPKDSDGNRGAVSATVTYGIEWP
jgi:hypothetical protein